MSRPYDLDGMNIQTVVITVSVTNQGRWLMLGRIEATTPPQGPARGPAHRLTQCW
jgi:hypothetical protein